MATPVSVKRDIYDEAADVIEKAQAKEMSIKSLVYQSNTKNIRQLYALVCESLKYASIIDTIMENTAFLHKVTWMHKNLALVLLYDFLFGKKLAGACSGKYRKAVVKQKKELKTELQRLKDEKGVKLSYELLPREVQDEIKIPRYARVNLLKTSVDEVMSSFIEAGYTCVMTREEARAERKNQSAQYISDLSVDIAKTLGKYEFAADLHLDDVLVFAAGTDFHDHPLYLQGSLILMDKASCIPAHVLAASPGTCVIDTCSAPGNKTSHIASLLGNEGKIFSFDLDQKRVGTMKKLLDRAGVTAAQPIHQDFLTTDPTSADYSDVEYLIVDPSCSGSGMVNRKDFLVDETMDGEEGARLAPLQRLQGRILDHALSFPAARRVVYSTCSVHQQENEDVVRGALTRNCAFRVVPVFPETWDHRGVSTTGINGTDMEADIGTMCLRASAKADATNGFFVACFERIGDGADAGIVKSAKRKDIADDQQISHKKKKKDTSNDREITKETKDAEHKIEDITTVSSESSDIKTKKKKKKEKKKKNVNGDMEDNDTTNTDSSSLLEGKCDMGTKMKKKKKKDRDGMEDSEKVDESVSSESLETSDTKREKKPKKKNCDPDAEPEKKKKKQKKNIED